MAATSQLRMYTINKGKMDEFVTGWAESIVPLRLKYGFRVDGAWVVQEQNRFVWILSYDGPDDWEARNRAYYESPERKALDPDPAQHIAHMETYLITPVLRKVPAGKSEPASHDERLTRARHLISQRHHKDAHELLLDYLKEHPKDADAWYLMAQSASDNAEARAALENALDIDPDHQEASVLLASLKGDAEIITYPTRPDVDMAALAAQRKAEREAAEGEKKSEEDEKE